MPADGGGGRVFDRRAHERDVRDRAEGARVKDNLLHWCKEADRQLNAFEYPKRMASDYHSAVVQIEEQLSPEQFQTETVEPLLVLRDFLSGKEPVQMFEKRMPKNAVIKDMAAKLLEHGRDPRWFASDDIEEISASLNFLAKRVEEWERKSVK